MALTNEYLELYDILTRGIEKEGKEATEQLLRSAEAKGFGVPTLKELSAGVGEKVAQKTAELGAKLGLAQREEKVRLGEAEKSRRFAKSQQLLSQAFQEKMAQKQFERQKQLLDWQYEKQKQELREAQKRARKAGWLQFGLSTLTGAAATTFLPSLFGLTKEITIKKGEKEEKKIVPINLISRLLTGGILGSSGLAYLLGQRLAPKTTLEDLFG